MPCSGCQKRKSWLKDRAGIVGLVARRVWPDSKPQPHPRTPAPDRVLASPHKEY